MTRRTKSQTLPIESARNTLIAIWATGGLLCFLVLMIQSILGKYEEGLQDVWAWFVPCIFPTLGLMIGVIGAIALQPGKDKRIVKKFFFQLSVVLSGVYLASLALTIFLEPFSPSTGIKLYTSSTYWLSPIQGLSMAAIAILFTSQEKES